MRCFFSYFYFLVILFLFRCPLLAAEDSVPLMPSGLTSAGVEDVSDRQYLQKVRELIGGARESIDLALSNVAIRDDHQDPVSAILEDLIRASKLDVRIRLFLNTFSSPDYEGSLFLRADVLERLRREGIHVHYVNPRYRIFDQILIVDQSFILEGGPPWVKEALIGGLGSATLTHSEVLARKKKTRLELLPLWDLQVQKEERAEGRLAVPLYLFHEVRYFPAMVTSDDGDALNIFLALLRLFYQKQDAEFSVSLEDLASRISAERYFERGAVIFQVLKTLQRLRDTYWLLEILEEQPDVVRVRLRLPRDLGAVVGVPHPFFDEGYSKQLSPAAIYAYCIILYRMQASGESPVWLGTMRNVEQDFPMTREKFWIAVTELRRQNLIEVFPFQLQQGTGYYDPGNFEYRYLMNPIRTHSERLATWTRLRDEFGEDNFIKARDAATLLGEPEDPEVLTVYLKLLERYKTEDILSLTRHVTALEQHSTASLLDYLQTLLKYETLRDEQLATF